MSGASTLRNRAAKVNPIVNSSNVYDTVPQSEVKKASAFVRAWRYMKHELGIDILEPLEQISVVFAMIFVGGFFLALPYIFLKYIFAVI